jgi:HPt (histidine-containing phosphotransfer) domain-containing protein
LDYEAIDAEVEAVFIQVKNEYACALPSKLKELEGAIDSARAQPDQLELFTHALNEVHRMKGTLGSYGFPELAELVASIELILRQNHDVIEGKAPLSSLWKRVNPQITAIIEEANRSAIQLSQAATKT